MKRVTPTTQTPAPETTKQPEITEAPVKEENAAQSAQSTSMQEKDSTSNIGWIVGIAIALTVLAGGVGIGVYRKKDK